MPGTIESCYPGITPDELGRLGTRIEQYRNQAAEKDRLQEQSGHISRNIGAARARGEATHELKSTMRQLSRELAALKASLAGIEQQIDEILDAAKQPAQDHADDTRCQTTPRYRSQHAANECYAVDLLQDETADWNAYAINHPATSLYHRAEWRNLITETFGHRAYYCIARNRAGQTVGILPLIRLSSRLFGDFIVSMPYFNYGGPLGDCLEVETALIEYAARLAVDLGVSHVEFRDEIPRDGMPSRTEKVNMILPLPDSADILWNSFPSKLRAQIRRAGREHSRTVHGGLELLDEFYCVFARNMRDLGTPVYGKSFFRHILETFPDDCRIIVSRYRNKPVAAAFLARSGDRMEIPWASTIREVNHLSINMLLYWEVLQYAIKSGCSSFDFGRSSVDSGTYRFKQQWGASPVQLYWHYWLGEAGELPSLNPSNPKYALFIRLWKRLPVAVTKVLGPPIVRNLP